LRGQIHIDDLAEELQLNVADIRALVARGELSCTGSYVTRASVERYRQARSRNFGELARAAWAQAWDQKGTALDRVLAAAASVTANEATGSDGGFAIPNTHAERILRFEQSQSLVSRCYRVTTPTNTIDFPTDHSAPWDSSKGIQVGFVREHEAFPQSKPALGITSPGKLHKFGALVPVTEELLADAAGLGLYLETVAAERCAFRADMEIFQGLGGALPLGIIKTPARVEIAKEASQTAATIIAQNIGKMFAAMPASSMPTAAWICHPDALPQLIGMTLNGQLIYSPKGGEDAPGGFLLGKPVLPHEAAEALG